MISVAGNFSCGDAVRPRLGLGPQHAYVSLPADGDVVELNLITGKPIATYAVGGSPGQPLVLGVDPVNRNAGPCSTCD